MAMHISREQLNAALVPALLFQIDQNSGVREVIALSLTPEDQTQVLDWAKKSGGVGGRGLSDRELDILREAIERSQDKVWQQALVHSTEEYDNLSKQDQLRHRTIDASYRVVAQNYVLAFRDDTEKLKDFVQLQKNADVIFDHVSLSGEHFKNLTAEQRKLFLEQIRIDVFEKGLKFEGVYGGSGSSDGPTEHIQKTEVSNSSRDLQDQQDLNAARTFLELQSLGKKEADLDSPKHSLLEGLRDVLVEISQERVRQEKVDEKKKKTEEEGDSRNENRSVEQMHRFEARLPFVNSLTFENEQMTHLTSRDYAKVMTTREFVEVVRGFINQFSSTEIQDAVDRKMSYNPKIREALDALDVAVVM